MKILVTGGTGLIGQHLCRALREEGHALTVLSRKPATVWAKCGAQAMASLAEYHPELHFDAVINLAGEPIVDARWTAGRKLELWNSRVALTEELVRRMDAAEQKPSVLLSGSAIGYYGNCGDLQLDEAADVGTDFPAKLCSAWEDAARVAQTAGVARVCLLRTGLVLSKQGGLLGRMLLPFRLCLGARLGDGRQWMSWVHIKDYIAMVQRLLHDNQLQGAYNLTAPHPVTNAEFTAALATAVHRLAFFAAPSLLLKQVMGERACLLLEGQRVLPSKLLKVQQHFDFPELKDALHDLIK